MKKGTRLLTGLVLLWNLAHAVPCPAGEDAADPFGPLRAGFAAVRSLRTDFVQEKRMKILARPLVSQGRFSYRAPADIRWEYTAPIRSVLLMEKGDVKRYTWRETGWVEDRGAGLESMQFVLQDISGWVAGDFETSANFRAEIEPGPPVRVVLIPRDPSLEAFIQRVVLTLADRPGVLRSVEIVEGPESSTLIEFRNTEVNVTFPPETFREAP